MQNQKGFVKILAVIIVIFVLLVTAPWMNKQIIHDNVLQQHGKIDGSVDKNDKIICDYEVMWLPFGRFVASCEGGHFVPFFKFKKINNRNQESSFAKKETVAWKTYRNEEYGFEFKYPQDYENFSSSDVSLGYRLSGMYLDSGKIQYKEKIIANVSLMAKPTKENSAPLIVVHIFPLSSYGYTYLSGGVEFDYDAVNNKWSQVKVENGKVVTKQIEVEIFSINGIKGYKLDSDIDADSGSVNMTAIPHKEKGFVLEFHFLVDQNTITESKLSLEDILSTFRFIK